MSLRPSTRHLRNLGIMAHIDAGKTTVSERLLFFSGRIARMGEVHEGGAVLDWMEQEQERGISIAAAATSCSWTRDGVEHGIRFIDTPGHVDFTIEVERSLRVLDGAILVICGVGGVEPQAETVWRQADRYGVPRVLFVNKMDRGGADFDAAVESARDRLGAPALPLQLPIGSGDSFRGVVDLVRGVALTFSGDRGRVVSEGPVPAEMLAAVAEARARLIEAAVGSDDALLERFLETGDLPEADLRAGLRRATLAREIFPVLCGSALRNQGIQPLLDAVVDYLPSPLDLPAVIGAVPGDPGERVERAPSDAEPFAGLVFKVARDRERGRIAFVRVYSGSLLPGEAVVNVGRVLEERVGAIGQVHANEWEAVESARAGDIVALAGLETARTGDTLAAPGFPLLLEPIRLPEPVISVAIEPVSEADREALSAALAQLVDEDPTLRLATDPESGVALLQGMGELHLEISVERLRREARVSVSVGRPSVAFRETIRGTARGVEGRFVRSTGLAGHFAQCFLDVEPAPAGSGLVLVDASAPSGLPRIYAEAIAEGVREALGQGVVGGFPVVDLRVEIAGGVFREEESSEAAFRIAGAIALREALRRAEPVLLEPIMEVEVSTPVDHLGDIMGDLSSRRGRIAGMGERGAGCVVSASVPLGEMFGYSTELRSMSRGRAAFSMQFAGYHEVPRRQG